VGGIKVMALKTISYHEYMKLDFRTRVSFTGIIESPESKLYKKDGYFHREDGPARIYFDGYQEWYFKGKLHNLNGPAIIWQDGTEEYWINDEPTIKEAVEFLRDLYKMKNIKL
jgi:ABC-type glycerol-3-phosphate transport system substrate-binding protein